MGRRSGEASMVIGSGSSIAILQERFKQLERVREKREEKELLQFADKTNTSPCPTSATLTLFEQSGMQQQNHQIKPTTEVHIPLSLELSCWKKFKHDDNAGESKNMSLSGPDLSAMGLKNFAGYHKSSEVDTSLHL